MKDNIPELVPEVEPDTEGTFRALIKSVLMQGKVSQTRGSKLEFTGQLA